MSQKGHLITPEKALIYAQAVNDRLGSNEIANSPQGNYDFLSVLKSDHMKLFGFIDQNFKEFSNGLRALHGLLERTVKKYPGTFNRETFKLQLPPTATLEDSDPEEFEMLKSGKYAEALRILSDFHGGLPEEKLLRVKEKTSIPKAAAGFLPQSAPQAETADVVALSPTEIVKRKQITEQPKIINKASTHTQKPESSKLSSSIFTTTSKIPFKKLQLLTSTRPEDSKLTSISTPPTNSHKSTPNKTSKTVSASLSHKKFPSRSLRKPAVREEVSEPGLGSDSETDAQSEEKQPQRKKRKTQRAKEAEDAKLNHSDEEEGEEQEPAHFITVRPLKRSKPNTHHKFTRDPNIWTPELRILLALEILNGPPHKKQEKGYNNTILSGLQTKYPDLFAEHTPRRIKDLKSKFHQAHVFLKAILKDHGHCFDPETFEVKDDGNLKAEFGKDRKWSCLERFQDPLKILNGYLGGLGDDLIKKYGWEKYFNADGTVVGELSYPDIAEKARANRPANTTPKEILAQVPDSTKSAEKSTVSKSTTKAQTRKVHGKSGALTGKKQSASKSSDGPLKITLKRPKKTEVQQPTPQPESPTSSTSLPSSETDGVKGQGRYKYINSSDNIIRKSKRGNSRMFKGAVSKKNRIIDFIVNTPFNDSEPEFELPNLESDSEDEFIRPTGTRTRKLKVPAKLKNQQRDLKKIRLNECVLPTEASIPQQGSLVQQRPLVKIPTSAVEYIFNNKPVPGFEQVWSRINSIPHHTLQEYNVSSKVLDVVSLDLTDAQTDFLAAKVCLDDRRFLINLTKVVHQVSQKT